MRRAFLITASVLMTGLCFSQKLPNVQQGSMRAPANVKVDGKIDEWGGMKAHNKTLDISYTMANDSANLYLTVSIENFWMSSKYMRGGLTLTINATGKRDIKNCPAVTYPKYENGKQILILTEPPESRTDPRYDFLADSLSKVRNILIAEKMKNVGVTGIKGIDDEMLSIYNEHGIKAIVKFDQFLNLALEIAVPLKFFNLKDKRSFAYNISLNGITANGGQIHSFPGRDDVLMYTGTDGKTIGLGKATPRVMDLFYPTDFWGEYTLAQ